MKILITGITGFVGSHLAEYILGLKEGHGVYGICRWRSPKDNLRNIYNKVRLVEADLCDLSAIIRQIKDIKPDIVFHLAAQSYVLSSFNSPIQTLWANVIGTANLLEAIRITEIDPICHVCSSSEVYGQVSEADVPIKETCPFRPASPYAVSKVAEDMLGYQYWISYGLRTIRTRMFTHSVSKWAPVILQDSESKLIDIKYISEIRKRGKKGGYFSGRTLDVGSQIWDLRRSGLEIWNDGMWSKIKHLSCHPLNNHKILEVACGGGVVDVTDNHSMINEKGDAVSANCLNDSEKLKITKLPRVELTEVPLDVAWLYGFFVAEGDTHGSKLRISNRNIDLLNRCKGILFKYFGCFSVIRLEKDVHRLYVRKSYELVKLFNKECYASDKNKRIPKIILNSSKEAKLDFLRGYSLGDGDYNKVKNEFYRFKTKSPILAMGLCYLVETVLDIPYKIHVEHKAEARYFEIRCLNQIKTKNGCWLLKNNNKVVSITELPYNEEVWDFETDNHWFHAGIGGNIVHNTGPKRGDVFAFSSFAKQIAAAELGLGKPIIRVGNLKSVRTICDVRDAVKAYWIMVHRCKPGEVYNIGGNQTLTIEEGLDKLLSFSKMKLEVKVAPELLRPSDVTLQIPCIDKFRSETGWQPEIPLEKTLEDILKYWREELKANPWKVLSVAK